MALTYHKERRTLQHIVDMVNKRTKLAAYIGIKVEHMVNGFKYVIYIQASSPIHYSLATNVLQSNGFSNTTLTNPSSHPDSVVDAHYGVWAIAGRKPQSIDASPLMTEDVDTLTITQLRAVLTAERAAHTATLQRLDNEGAGHLLQQKVIERSIVAAAGTDWNGPIIEEVADDDMSQALIHSTHIKQIQEVEAQVPTDWFFADGEERRVTSVHVNAVPVYEKHVRDMLSTRERGEPEVYCPVGYADVVTSSEVIEVKYFRRWKHALGQVIAYSAFHVDKQRRVHLFAENSEAAALAKVIAVAEPICSNSHIRITLETFASLKRKSRS